METMKDPIMISDARLVISRGRFSGPQMALRWDTRSILSGVTVPSALPRETKSEVSAQELFIDN